MFGRLLSRAEDVGILSSHELFDGSFLIRIVNVLECLMNKYLVNLYNTSERMFAYI